MTLKFILVPLSGTVGDRTALETALAVASHFKAHLETLFVAPDPRESAVVLGDGLSTLMVEDIIAASRSAWDERRREARRSFEAAVAGRGLREVAGPEPGGGTVRWREVTGRTEEKLIAEARLADLLVFARSADRSDAHETQGRESALLQSGRPVLLASTPPATLGRTVAVAWNGRLEAARAVTAAMPFLAAADQVHILTLRAGHATGSEGARLAEALAWHGIAATATAIVPESGPPFGALMRQATDLGSDLLVMGGYGHSRLQEMILGGATRYVLTHDGPPVLLVH